MKLRINNDPPIGQDEITVVLSRRNVMALLHKLDMQGSARELRSNDYELDGELEPGWSFTLKVEEDWEHYADRNPGRMHPATEQYLRLNR